MNILRQLFEIILNKRAPEDIDHSVYAAVMLSAAHVFTYFTVYSLFKEFSQPLLYAFVISASYLLSYAVLLKLQGKENRIVQTVTVLFGAHFILSTLTLLLLATQYLAIFALALWVYSLILFVRIIKKAFSCPNYLAIVILIVTHVFSSMMLSIVSPKSSIEAAQMLENVQKVLEEQSSTTQETPQDTLSN